MTLALILAMARLWLTGARRRPAPGPRTWQQLAAAERMAQRRAAHDVHAELGQARAELSDPSISRVLRRLYAKDRDRVGLFTIAAMWTPLPIGAAA